MPALGGRKHLYSCGALGLFMVHATLQRLRALPYTPIFNPAQLGLPSRQAARTHPLLHKTLTKSHLCGSTRDSSVRGQKGSAPNALPKALTPALISPGCFHGNRSRERSDLFVSSPVLSIQRSRHELPVTIMAVGIVSPPLPNIRDTDSGYRSPP